MYHTLYPKIKINKLKSVVDLKTSTLKNKLLENILSTLIIGFSKVS